MSETCVNGRLLSEHSGGYCRPFDPALTVQKYNCRPVDRKGREIPCVATSGMTEPTEAMCAESLLNALLENTVDSVRRFFRENPEKLKGVRYFTIICDRYQFNSIQELADSLKPGWTPAE